MEPSPATAAPPKAILLLWEGSGNDILRSLLLLAGGELRALGYDVREVTIPHDGWKHRLVREIEAGGVAFALGMSGLGVDVSATIAGVETLLWDAAKLPLFNWNCDHPCHFPPRHALRSRYLLHGYIFADHARYGLAHMRGNGAAYSVHLGIPERSLLPAPPRPPHRRNGRFVFAKNSARPDALEARWRGYVEPTGRILFAAAEELRGAATEAFLPVLQRIAGQHGLHLDGANGLTLQMLQELDRYCRARSAHAVVQAALDFPVDIHGDWSHIRNDRPHSRLLPAVPWRDYASRLPGYLGCLSLNPLTEGSTHDRVFLALAAHVAPVSESNVFSRAHMPRLERYAFPPPHDAASAGRVAAGLQAVLDAPGAALAETEATWAAMLPEFAMRRSLQQIVGLVSLAQMNSLFAP